MLNSSGNLLKRVQVSDYGLYFFLTELVAEARHHTAALNHRLDDMFVCRGQPTGQVRLAIETFESRTFVAMGRISRVAINTVNVEDLATRGLLRIQPEFRVGHGGGIFSTADGH